MTLSGGQIAEKENIPPKFLEAILFDLHNAEYIFNRKDARGGYLLTRPLEDILMLDIIRHAGLLRKLPVPAIFTIAVAKNALLKRAALSAISI